MAYICGNSSSIYVSLFVSGPYTTVHIRQHLNAVDATTGNTINQYCTSKIITD